MHICITRSEKYAYSETFIRDQIAGFSELAEVYTIHSGRFPERKEDGTLLSPKPFWILHKLIKTFVGRNNFFSNYGVKKYLKENEIDVVLSNYGISASHMMPVCKKLNIPLLVIFHGHDATNKKTLHKYKKKYEALFNYASYIIVVSEEMKKGLIKNGAIEEKIRVIPCGVNPLKFTLKSYNKSEKNFLAVGRFTQKKGPLYTIRAFNEVLKKYPEAILTMVGKKNGLFDACNALVSELGIQNSINFPGVLEQKDIAHLMQNSLAFVQHSVTAENGDMEGTPVSVMEASSTGLPIISTLHGGIKDAVIHNKTGFLVEETNFKDMANYMINLCDNPEKAKELGLNGREQIEKNYHQEKQINKLYNLAKETIEKK
ncbi:Glycosyltransferase involved in cell wall bisynthesis [Flaviramulus basaltis]|uniref:Glycosyltransferase involved in cell wall bisynthesis n=1 Tax=Flaviramulus basaltis TaxID=369401 RepID=A0A1K2INH6_9FLAO|nr:glycosyltransferase family 4 protein [Flaviramulus basaltis]SFZ93996.1 Glycosyltransferase involved in cell wall bisynthesis [Flaviramulus basaltis]